MHHKKRLKKKISLTLDSDIIEQVKYLAKKDERSTSQYINYLLHLHLTRLNEHNHKNQK